MQTEMSGSLAFGLDWDRDYFLRISPPHLLATLRLPSESLRYIVLICFDVYNGLLYQAWINCVYGTWLYLREITWTKNENR
ncbi:hypothetical protein PRIPAC_88780 [Pristionchus pacificus]|uniref:Uncharacterized protein n=1 Tax=Pristionchus pacificus TaxID=54126 RepID=A0A2A6CU18_PRIPA|nr:hypothetical protein PRIPAC_88780 [Pristionchus pacificus]|eukprot:PDM81547.1 hypothetical protein PRIPAC_35423 [Pristionchus pacificus]